MVVLSSDELVAQTYTHAQSVLVRDRQDESPAYSSQRLASPVCSSQQCVVEYGLISTYSSRRHGRRRGRTAGVTEIISARVSIALLVNAMTAVIYGDDLVA